MEKEMNGQASDPMEEFEDINIVGGEQGANAEETQSRKEKKNRKEKKAEQALNDLQKRYDDLNDKYLRLFSDFDNFRRRSIKEKSELTKTASEEIMIKLLDVVDDFERAIDIAVKSKENNQVVEGIQLIYNKLIKILLQKGLEEIQAKDQPFDTDYHEALTNITVNEASRKGTVIEVVQKGYLLGGKVIRFAKVVVGS
ncbi:MAG: nucleotide exchange factor GrpE [Bacteroidales bacterium]|nr:nucleotide exchange factor GrpE [Bacteroidales bacterium]